MKYFTNLSTRAKLLFSFGLIWLMFLAVIIVSYRSSREVIQSEKDIHDVHFRIMLDYRQLRSNQNYELMRILEMMSATKKPDQEAAEKDVRVRSKETDDILHELDSIDTDPYCQKKLQELKNIVTEFEQTREKVISLIYMGKLDEAKALRFGVQAQRIEMIRNTYVELGDKSDKEVDSQLALDMQNADASVNILLIFGALSILCSFVIVLLLNRTIAYPLIAITKTASQISMGNLKVELIADERKDEVGLLNQAFYKMVQKLRGSIEEIIEGVNLLGSSASEILAATTQVASGSAETATAITETTTTVEEVRQAAQLSNQKASRVSENAQQVSQVTLSGQIAVDETISGMHDIQNQMEAVANTIVRLSEQSQQIGGIIASVTDVADQSNLLAVNAAIEAAKAGEQGKGFAVVAQEIKSLAQQSKQATIQVRNILTDVQKATSAAVMATEQTSKAVENGVKQSTLAGDAIKKLAESSGKALEAASQIVASSQQQVVGMDQIGLAMQNINQAGTENSASMVQAEKAAKGLHELGQKLKLLVEQYQI
jgi:methyl-accepting chemotaxis protein